MERGREKGGTDGREAGGREIGRADGRARLPAGLHADGGRACLAWRTASGGLVPPAVGQLPLPSAAPAAVAAGAVSSLDICCSACDRGDTEYRPRGVQKSDVSKQPNSPPLQEYLLLAATTSRTGS